MGSKSSLQKFNYGRRGHIAALFFKLIIIIIITQMALRAIILWGIASGCTASVTISISNDSGPFTQLAQKEVKYRRSSHRSSHRCHCTTIVCRYDVICSLLGFFRQTIKLHQYKAPQRLRSQ
jgi:hypothetical protein